MIVLKNWVIILALFASSCAIITIEQYVHEDTSDILNTFYWTTEKRTLNELIGDDQKGPIIVPDFNRFEFGTLILRVITRGNTQVTIDRIEISSEVTGETEERITRRVTSPQERNPGFWVATVTISDMVQSGAFADADKIMLSVAWSDGKSGANSESTFELIRKRRTDVAWVT